MDHESMTTMSNRQRVLEAIRISAQPLDDDELARRVGIEPRQTVNQICRALESDGVIRRRQGPDGKIVNELLSREAAGPADDQTTEAPRSQAPIELPPGDSLEQRQAERIMLALLGKRLGVALSPARLTVPSGARVEIDGADDERSVLVECWAHQGPPKPAQRNKVLADALKLTWIGSTIYPRPRLILCLSDQAAVAPFLPSAKSWSARALEDLKITVEVVELPVETRDGILRAQVRQYR